MSDSLWIHGLQHARLLCSPLSPGVCSNLCPSSQWYYLITSSSAAHFCLQSLPASGSFPMSWLFTSGGQSTGASASAMNEYSGLISFTIDWFALAVQRMLKNHNLKNHQFFSTQPSLWSKSHSCTWFLEKL